MRVRTTVAAVGAVAVVLGSANTAAADVFDEVTHVFQRIQRAAWHMQNAAADYDRNDDVGIGSGAIFTTAPSGPCRPPMQC